jgi:hypothetical protein
MANDTEEKPHNYMPELIMAICGINPFPEPPAPPLALCDEKLGIGRCSVCERERRARRWMQPQ